MFVKVGLTGVKSYYRKAWMICSININSSTSHNRHVGARTQFSALVWTSKVSINMFVQRLPRLLCYISSLLIYDDGSYYLYYKVLNMLVQRLRRLLCYILSLAIMTVRIYTTYRVSINMFVQRRLRRLSCYRLSLVVMAVSIYTVWLQKRYRLTWTIDNLCRRKLLNFFFHSRFSEWRYLSRPLRVFTNAAYSFEENICLISQKKQTRFVQLQTTYIHTTTPAVPISACSLLGGYTK